MPGESVDLIYLDPPFNSNRAYNVIYPDDMGQAQAFNDTWHWTPECDEALDDDSATGRWMDMLRALVDGMGKTQMTAYLVNMTPRLAELRRILKPAGSLYLHCDPTASHYLKVMMDVIFGQENFRQDIVWYRYNKIDDKRKIWTKFHDNILCYSSGKNPVWNPLSIGTGETITRKKMKKVEGRITNTDEMIAYEKTKCLTRSVIDDVHDIQIGKSRQKLGYPTQKSLPLLERILRVSSNPGDTVLDPFCGCGTTVHAAENLNRNWIGIDVTYAAIGAIRERFRRDRVDIWKEIEILNVPKTVEDVEARMLSEGSEQRARKEFEKFCVGRVRGLANDKMGADGGIDGRIALRGRKQAIISVKSGHVGVEQVRALRGLLDEKQVAGVFITRHPPTKPMLDFANRSGLCRIDTGRALFKIDPFPRMQILTLEKILEGNRPDLPYADAA